MQSDQEGHINQATVDKVGSLIILDLLTNERVDAC